MQGLGSECTSIWTQETLLSYLDDAKRSRVEKQKLGQILRRAHLARVHHARSDPRLLLQGNSSEAPTC